ncbi:MAG: class GN sortase [Burkholderiaceae bacterium]
MAAIATDTGHAGRTRQVGKASWRIAALVLAAVLGLAALVPMGQSLWILGKAHVAQWLIAAAWQDNLDNPSALRKPWSWADTTPVARLRFVRQQAQMIVLSGDSGRILAFGPGHRVGSALPGQGGNSVISGHRDTHFAVLGQVRDTDAIEVETLDGQWLRYQVEGRQVVDKHEIGVTRDRGRDELTLVTCWPLDALTAGGPLRLVVHARRVTS